jgi:glutamate--cysteine ligase
LTKLIDECLDRFQIPEFQPDWARVQRGIEKESLRTTPSGSIALSEHPKALGSALTNPFITTDFSEALLEFITPANNSIDDCLGFLDAIHRFTYQHLENDERLWVCSMPCPTGDLEDIPLARYGNSNIGRLKTLYRSGLSHRYSSLMQVISGIHYNFSMPQEFWPEFQKQCGDSGSVKEFRTSKYLHLLRNFNRYSWLLIYLFGASPVTCKCFAKGRDHSLEEYDDGTLYLPDATCLRMSKLGYQSDAQKSIFVCYNDLDSYVESLNSALHTNYPPYEEIDKKANGNHLQINTNLLQLENEFYSSVRPKRVTNPGERPLSALLRDGIEYVEVRALDLNPFLPLGIDAQQIRFLDAFLVFCLLDDSPNCNRKEQVEIAGNIEAVVERGRSDSLSLTNQGEAVSMRDWATDLLDNIAYSAGLLDQGLDDQPHAAGVLAQKNKIDDSTLTPSGQVLAAMQKDNISFYKFGMSLSEQHRQFFNSAPLNAEYQARLDKASIESLAKQSAVEDSDAIDFDSFLTQWNSYKIELPSSG